MHVARRLMLLLLGRRLPITTGTLTVPGVESDVIIQRDRWGVPIIEAGSDADAWYGLGFCHGQDRAFQLESLLRVVRGTLAELVGPDGLPVDRLSRRIGFLHAAEQHLSTMSLELRSMLGSYAGGVNAGATVGVRKRAHEFVLTRSKPTPWRAADVVGYIKLTSFLLATNWDVELARLKILREDGPEALAALDPTYAEWQPVISPPGELAGPAQDRLLTEIEALLQVSHAGGGSNNWAVAPANTATGRPILANDPHLSPALPPHWYLAHIRTPDWAVAGASFVGFPNIPVGHNGFAAWGVTVGMTDNTDLFVEEIGPDGRSVRQGSEFVPCEVRQERIAVKGAPDATEEVLVTPRGPIIGPAMGDDVGAISMRAVWLDPHPMEGLLHLHRTSSFDDFHRHTSFWPALPLNLAYADASGSIGWQLIGNAPRRRKGRGALPLPGWDPDAGWEEDLVPHEEMPYLVSPERGFVVTANNKATPDGAGPFLTVDWIEGYRAARILEALKERDSWDLDATSRLQMDQMSLPWWEMREVVLAAPARDDDTSLALELLRNWDGRAGADSPAAAVFELFVAEMARRVARAKAPKSYRWALGEGFHPLTPHNTFGVRRVGHLVRLLRDQPPGWFGRPWEDEIGDALRATIRHLQDNQGEDSARWAWGHVRPLTLVHPFGARKPFDRIFNLGPIPWGGDANTPAQAEAPPLEPTGNPPFIASLRMVVDVGAWDNSRFILPGGQSGNPLSPHYWDQFLLWKQGEGIPIPWSDSAREAAATQTLRLASAGDTAPYHPSTPRGVH